MVVKKIPLINLRDALEAPTNVFIGCASFEERCKSVANHLNQSAVIRAIIAENKKLTEYVGTNADYLRRLFAGKCLFPT